MTQEIQEAQNILARTKASFAYGLITYDEAKELAQPQLDILNKKVEEVAKKYNKKPYKITFTSFIR